MWKSAVSTGALLVVIGVGGYLGTGQASVTALIPAGLGVLLVLCGALARRERMRKHAMHAAAAVGLLGFLGSAPGLARVVRMLGGAEIERPVAALLMAITAVICALFVGACVKSFMDARLKQDGG